MRRWVLQIKDGPWISPDAGVRLVEASLLFGDAEVSAEMHAGDVEGVMFTAQWGERVCRMDLGDIEQARYMTARLRRTLPGCKVRWSLREVAVMSTPGAPEAQLSVCGVLLAEMPEPMPFEATMERLASKFKLDGSIGLMSVDDWQTVIGVTVWLGLPIELEVES